MLVFNKIQTTELTVTFVPVGMIFLVPAITQSALGATGFNVYGTNVDLTKLSYYLDAGVFNNRHLRRYSATSTFGLIHKAPDFMEMKRDMSNTMFWTKTKKTLEQLQLNFLIQRKALILAARKVHKG